MNATRYGPFDVDNHHYESPDALTRYLEPDDFRKLVDRLPEDEQRWILRENGFRLVMC